jgi:hypothetical protein
VSTFFSLAYSVYHLCRFETQAQVRHTARTPTAANIKEVNHLREVLGAEFSALDAILQGINMVTPGESIPFDSQDDFGNIDDEVLESDENDEPTGNLLPIEHRQLPLPSYQNFRDANASVELRLRQKQANNLLQSIRDTVADKSFQYSHVLRVAPRKSVKTRTRAAIQKINSRVAVLCCAYNRTRLAMLRLGAEQSICERFKPLTRSDVKASTALLDPNIPGASTLRLSWIWQMHHPSESTTSASLLECKGSFLNAIALI